MEKTEAKIIKKKKTGWILVGIVAVLLVVVISTVVMLVLSKSGNRKLQEQLDLGEKYISELKYEQAIIAYESAIEIEPMSVEAYLGLAEVYVAQGDYEKAISVLEEGYKITYDERIKSKLEEINKLNISAEDINTVEPDFQGGEFDSTLAYEEFLKELITQHGFFKSNQTGVMVEYTDKWLDTKGILGSLILDFDSDGRDELLVCYTQEDGDKYNIMIDMYDISDNEIYLADSIRYTPYSENLRPTQIVAAEWSEMMLSMTVINVNTKFYLICEEQSISSAFADGSSQDYWILEYCDDKLQYVGSFTQTGGGSSDFEYTGFKFKDGKIIESKIYYSEWYEDEMPLYTEFNSALTGFFNDYNISVDKGEWFSTILTDKNDTINVFIFKTILVDNNYLPPYQFEAILESGNSNENAKETSLENNSLIAEQNAEGAVSQILIKDRVVGKWVIDSDYSAEYNNISMYDLYGSAFGDYGSGMEFGENGEFSYYIGAGVGGRGTADYCGDEIYAEITEYESGNSVNLCIWAVESEDDMRLAIEEQGLSDTYTIFWKKL